MVVDRHPDRLALAEKIGAIPIDDAEGSPVEQIMELTGGKGADRGCECVGYQAHDPQGHEHPNMTLNNLVQSVKFTGTHRRRRRLRAAGSRRAGRAGQAGRGGFDFGLFWFKGQTMGTGQCNVKDYNRQLRDLIDAGKAQAVVHRLPRVAARARRRRHTSTSTDGTTDGRRSSSTRTASDSAGKARRRAGVKWNGRRRLSELAAGRDLDRHAASRGLGHDDPNRPNNPAPFRPAPAAVSRLH